MYEITGLVKLIKSTEKYKEYKNILWHNTIDYGSTLFLPKFHGEVPHKNYYSSHLSVYRVIYSSNTHPDENYEYYWNQTAANKGPDEGLSGIYYFIT